MICVPTMCFFVLFKTIMCADDANTNTEIFSGLLPGMDPDIWEIVDSSNITLWQNIDLGDGNHEVYLENYTELKVAIFELGNNGHQILHGGLQSRNEFNINSCNGTLTGELVGGNGLSVVTISSIGFDSCAFEKEISAIITKDVSILTIGENDNILLRDVRHIWFNSEGLSLGFDGSENWQVTMHLSAIYGNHSWNYVQSRKTADPMKTLCSFDNVGLNYGIVCSVERHRVMIWITLINICVSVSFLVGLLIYVYVNLKNKNYVSM